MPGHGASDSSLNEEDFSSSPFPLLFLQRKASKENFELDNLVYITRQTPKLAMRIRQLMT